MRNIIKTTLIFCISMLSITLYAQDISNLEKSKLEATLKELVIKEVNSNPAFVDFKVSNSNVVKFERFVSQNENPNITDKEHLQYGIKKRDIMMRVIFLDDDGYFIVNALVKLQSSKIQAILRSDNLILSGNLIKNIK